MHVPIQNMPMDQVEAFCRKWGIQELSVFGSVLRDDYSPQSDVDVLVTFQEGAGWSYWNWPQMQDDLRAIFGHEADIVVKEGLRNPFRRNEILSTRRVLYAA